jgi:hypothetical protein
MGYNQHCCSTYLFHLDHSWIVDRYAVRRIGGEPSRQHGSIRISMRLFRINIRVKAYLYVLLQVLRTFEGFSTEITFVRLQWDVDSDMGGDMIALDSGGTA